MILKPVVLLTIAIVILFTSGRAVSAERLDLREFAAVFRQLSQETLTNEIRTYSYGSFRGAVAANKTSLAGLYDIGPFVVTTPVGSVFSGLGRLSETEFKEFSEEFISVLRQSRKNLDILNGRLLRDSVAKKISRTRRTFLDKGWSSQKIDAKISALTSGYRANFWEYESVTITLLEHALIEMLNSPSHGNDYNSRRLESLAEVVKAELVGNSLRCGELFSTN